MSNTVTDLRSILFDAIAGVKSGSIDLDKAKTINELSRTLVDTARAENDHLKITGGTGSDFISGCEPPAPRLHGAIREATAHGTRTTHTIAPGATVTVHKMR